MKYDEVGQAYCDSRELCDLLYKNPELDLTKFLVSDPGQYNSVRKQMHYTELPALKSYIPFAGDIDEFHAQNQTNWVPNRLLANVNTTLVQRCRETVVRP